MTVAVVEVEPANALAVSDGGALPRALIAGVVLALAAACQASAQTAISVRSVLVTVSDGQGQPVVGLLPGDFAIEAEGIAVDALGASPARFPLVLMVDTGAAAGPLVTNFRAPLTRFAERSLLSPQALVTFGDTPLMAVKFTPDVARMVKGINGLFARPDTASFLLDGLQRVVAEVKRLEAPVADVVVVTAATSDASRRDVTRLARDLVAAGIRVHVVMDRARVFSMPSPPLRSARTVSPADMMLYTSRERAAVLNDVAAVTRGTFQQVDLMGGLQGALQRLHERHLGEYVVDFVPPFADLSAEHLRVRVNLAGAQVRVTSTWAAGGLPRKR